MSQVFLETEHQELFYLDADLRQPVPVHIPSALGKLGYYVCLRIPAAMADQLRNVVTSLKVGGLRPDDVTLRYGEGFSGPDTFPGADDSRWVLLCRAMVSRGDGLLPLQGLPAGLHRAHVLLCTWPRFISSGQADDWVACQQDPQWAPNGVPLGGIGCGKVEFCRDGRFRNFSGNNNQDLPFEEPDGLPGAFLAVAADDVEHVLATRPAANLPPCPTLHTELRFPQVRVQAPDAVPGIDVDVRLAGSLVPHDLRRSSLPGFLVRWEVTNRRPGPCRVRLRLAWPNLVGSGGGLGAPETRLGYGDGFYRFWTAPAAPQAEVRRTHGLTILRYGNAPSPVCPSADGWHYVAVRGDQALVEADPCRGSVIAELALGPGGRGLAEMAVVWEMPHWIDSQGRVQGHYWQHFWRNGEDLLAAMFADFTGIIAGGGALAALLRDTDLPTWLQERLSNCCYPLVTNSVCQQDGRFSVNEGPTEMAGCYGTLDQRLAAHPATQLLFPELNARELNQFAAIQAANGGVAHDFGGGHLDRGPTDQGWPDLTCSFILQHARHAWSTGDPEFAQAAWPRCRRALLRHAEWAEAGGGVAQVGHGLGTSYDGYHYDGTTPYLATLWLATLLVARRWAEQQGDSDLLPRIDAWRAAALNRLETDLWNGRYYRAYGSPTGPLNDNSHAGMLAGEYYARLLAGADVLPADRLAACADVLAAAHGSDRFAIPPDEVTPDGAAGCEFGWLPYVESFGLAPLAILRHPGALPLWERMVGYLTEHGRRPCDTRLMYRPLTGEPSWGSYYMTAPASWLVYEALLDFFYTPQEQVLRLSPVLGGRFAVVHPLFWGIGSREPTADGEHVSLTVRCCFGASDLKVAQLEVPASCQALVDGTPLAAAAGAGGCYRRYVCPRDWALRPGTTLRWCSALVAEQ